MAQNRSKSSENDLSCVIVDTEADGQERPNKLVVEAASIASWQLPRSMLYFLAPATAYVVNWSDVRDD